MLISLRKQEKETPWWIEWDQKELIWLTNGKERGKDEVSEEKCSGNKTFLLKG